MTVSMVISMSTDSGNSKYRSQKESYSWRAHGRSKQKRKQDELPLRKINNDEVMRRTMCEKVGAVVGKATDVELAVEKYRMSRPPRIKLTHHVSIAKTQSHRADVSPARHNLKRKQPSEISARKIKSRRCYRGL